jgi:glutamate racemase
VLDAAGLRRPADQPGGRIELMATDSAERFARVGGTFLGRPLVPADVEVVDL